jgi:GMP synthase (glutamine-hydrolysing)
MSKKVLILDYSLDAFETPLVESAIPSGFEIQKIHVKTGEDIPEKILRTGVTHVIHTGSTLSSTDDSPFMERAIRVIRAAVGREIWQFGICFGHQLLNRVLVGKHAIRSIPRGMEVGWKKVWFLDAGKHLFNVNEDEILFEHHNDEVVEMPLWSELLATNNHTHIQAFINYDLKLLGTQFHPEFDEVSGNEFIRKDKVKLENDGINVDEILQGKPSIDSRKTFFEIFLRF